MGKIDLDRGVTVRTDPKTGAQVYMYKKEPGVFLNAFGGEVADSLARRCGFDVTKLKAEKAKREAMTTAMEAVEAEYEAQQKGEATEKVIKETADGYKAVQYAFGRCHVFDPEGQRVTERFLTVDEAKHFLRELDKTPGAEGAGSSDGEDQGQEAPKPKPKQEKKDGKTA